MHVAVNGSNFGKTIIGKYEGDILDLRNKIIFYLACWKSLVYAEQLYLPQ